MDILIVVDMQNDFITGTLGSLQAQNIVQPVCETIQNFKGDIIYTRDTHQTDYLQTNEGINLPIEHCIEGSEGWQFHPLITQCNPITIFNKPTFGSIELMLYIQSLSNIKTISLVGLCTDICVISNAILLKNAIPETTIQVLKDCCAGVTLDSHQKALDTMRSCQIKVI